jgi:hypothetical protein
MLFGEVFREVERKPVGVEELKSAVTRDLLFSFFLNFLKHFFSPFQCFPKVFFFDVEYCKNRILVFFQLGIMRFIFVYYHPSDLREKQVFYA